MGELAKLQDRLERELIKLELKFKGVQKELTAVSGRVTQPTNLMKAMTAAPLTAVDYDDSGVKNDIRRLEVSEYLFLFY